MNEYIFFQHIFFFTFVAYGKEKYLGKPHTHTHTHTHTHPNIYVFYDAEMGAVDKCIYENIALYINNVQILMASCS